MSVTPENEFQKRRAAREAQKEDDMRLEGVAHIECRDDGFDLLLAFNVTSKSVFSRIYAELNYENPAALEPKLRKRRITLINPQGQCLDKFETPGKSHVPPVCDLSVGVVYFEMDEYREILEKVIIESGKQAVTKSLDPAADKSEHPLDKAVRIPTEYLTASRHIRLFLDAVNSSPMPA